MRYGGPSFEPPVNVRVYSKPSRSELVSMLVMAFTFSGYPLIAGLTPFTSVSNRLVSFGFRALVFLAFVPFAFRLRIARTDRNFWMCWGAFCGLYIFRLVYDGTLHSARLHYGLTEYLAWSVGATFVPSLAPAVVNFRKNERRIFNLMFISSVVAVLLNLYQTLYGPLRFASERAQTTILNPITLGQLSGTALLLSVWAAVRWSWRWCSAGGIAVGIAGVVLAGSKGPLLSLFVVLVAYLSIQRRQISKRLPTICFVALSGVVLASTLDLSSIYIIQRIQTTGIGDADRSALLRQSMGLVAKHPVLGPGFDPLSSYPHNIIVESFLIFGVFAGFLLLSCFYLTWRRVKAFFSTVMPCLWTGLIFLQYLTSAMVSGSIDGSAMLFTSMILVVSASRSMASHGELGRSSISVSRKRVLPMPAT
jgi:hypothetical protein